MRNKPDKRYYSRLKTNNFPIEYKITNSDGVYKADVINISAGGTCFLRSSILEKGNIIQLKFAFHSKKIILTGEVIRIEGREAAVKFLDDERQIERFVEYFNSEFWGSKSITKRDVLLDDIEDKKKEKENFDNIFDIEKD